MTSIRTALEVDRVPAEPSTAVSLALRLTGIRVELDPRSRFRPSRKIRLTVGGVGISAVFQSPPGLSLWTWEIESETPVLITTGSRIIIQPYAARPFKLRKKAKIIIIQDDVVLRLLSTSAIPGAICEHEHPETNFRLFLLFVAEGLQMRVMDETDTRGQTATPGGGSQEVQPNPRMAPGFLEPCLISLQYLMQSLPSSASELHTTGKEAHDALKRACDLPSTGNLDEDVNHLGKQIQGLLDYVQKPIFSEHLASLTQTVKSFFNLVENAAMFLEECLNPELNNDLVNPESRMTIMKDFDKQLTILKTSFTVRRDFSVRRLPYARKPAIVPSESALPAPFPVGGGAAWNSTGNQGQEQGSGKSKLERLRIALRPASTGADSLDLGCLGGTRTEFLSEIITWLNDQSASNVLWLCGAPGTGKTTIFWSLIAELKRQQRCAGIFLFGQGEDEYRLYRLGPSELWRTLAYEMARFHPAIECEIYDAVATQTNNKLDINNVKITFQKLVKDPLKATAMSLFDLSPVFLIDALEKCNQDSSWAMLLHTLSQWPSLPRHCKLIITSQPQSDILNVMHNVIEDKSIKRMDLSMGDADNSVTTKEIRTYIEHRFAEMRRIDESIPNGWPDFRAVSELVKHANGFFKWAVVAMDDISSERAEERAKRLLTIIERGSATNFFFLDQYFRGTLLTTVGRSRTFRATMGTVVFSKEPLPMGDLHRFLQDRFVLSKAKDLTEMVYKLSPLITFNGEDKIVKLGHNAYRDYLVDSQRCPSIWCIDKGRAHRRMAISCFKIMQRALKFNICGLETSYLMNEDVEDKDVLVKNSIPSYLSYACRFWGDHLHDVQRDNETEIVKLLKDFLTVHLFHWFEVLSLLDESRVAAASLRVAATWLKGIDEKLSLLAADGSRFAVTFAEVISKSAPHIYLSALPFTPPSSPIYTHYYPRFSRTVKISYERDPRWPPVQFSLAMENDVNSISIHPDGERLAAGLDSGLVLVIDIKSGQTCFLLKGHRSTVRTVAYSQSGTRIATGCDDGELRVFAAKDGSLLSGPFSLHLDWIRSIAWSPDEKQILTGSDDNKVKVVAVETGEVIHTMAFHRSWVRAVISTQDTFISCSNDRTVQFYDQSSGQPWMSWSTMQTGDILAIAISRDKILASGGDDSTILLYNVDKNAVHELLRGHTEAIRSLAFSVNGEILASGSDDCTVRLWNVHTGKNICDPLEGHTSGVSSVAFSPDMKQLITGGTDRTIKFFDIGSLPVWGKDTTGVTGQFKFLTATLLNNGRALLAFDGSRTWRSGVDGGNLDVNVENVPFADHSDRLSKIQVAAISPDGELVATAASDYRVTIWQVKSGKALYGPLSGHTGNILVLSFSVDSKMVASGSYDCSVWVWSANTGQAIHGPMECHEGRVTGLCFSRDGKQVASGSIDNTAIIWSVDSGKKVVGPLEHHTDWIYGLAYSPDGLYLATASDDYTVAIWDSATGEHVFDFPTGHKEYLRVINWSSDSRRIVTGALDNTIRVFDVKTGSLVCEPLTGHTTNPIAVAFRSSSFHHDVDSEIISVSRDGTARVWELKTKDSTESRSHPKHHRDWILSVDISPVDDHIATGGDDGKLIVVDAITGRPKFSCDAHEYWIRCVTYSPDGMMIATCSDDGTISVWNADIGNRLLGPFNCNVGPVLSVAFSLDGNVLVSGNDDTTVRSWTLDRSTPGTILPLSTYVGHTCPVRTVAYARMGERIVSGSEDAEIAVWEGRNGNKLVWKKQGHDGPNLSIAISGEEIFSGSEDKIIRVWDLDTGDIKSIIHGHAAPIKAIRLSPDGRWIVSASDDARMRVLDPHTGQQHVLSEPIPFRIISIAISRDGKLVACCGADGQVQIWRPDIAAPVWPDSFIRRVHGLEYYPVDNQGIHVNTTLRDDGWLCRSTQGSTGEVTEAMCWIPPAHRPGLITQWTKEIFGAPVTALDARKFVHGTKWEQCSDDYKQLEPLKEMLQILLD